MTDLPFACRCGTVSGALHDAGPAVGTRLVCYCRHCRAYVRRLGDEGVLAMVCDSTNVFDEGESVLARYYEQIADWIMPHIVKRPLSLYRCPDGYEKECFFQKHLGAMQVPRFTNGN